MQFIEYRPAVTMVIKDGTVEVVREREDLGYVTAQERLPASLARSFEDSA
jgi:diaminopimelate decarboxylase